MQISIKASRFHPKAYKMVADVYETIHNFFSEKMNKIFVI